MKEAQVVEFVNIARRIESFYGSPQDIEWCHAESPSPSGRGRPVGSGEGEFFILQSRPITTLPKLEIPAPTEWKLPKGAYAAMRNNIVELMADPLSPLFATLGREAINNSLHRIMKDSFGMGGIMPEEIIIIVNRYAYNNGSISAKSMARVTFGAEDHEDDVHRRRGSLGCYRALARYLNVKIGDKTGVRSFLNGTRG
jgi:pyruvate,water dikinase